MAKRKPNSSIKPAGPVLMPTVMDYNCKLCSPEILNKIMHCFGCKMFFLAKDFNVCVTCHLENMHGQFMIMCAGAIVTEMTKALKIKALTNALNQSESAETSSGRGVKIVI
jgi:hypothetical protein